MARHMHGFRDGTVAERLNMPTIRALPVLLPSLLEQESIEEIAGVLEDKIELNRHTNETLEGIARALFKSWFIDFDPVRAKVNGASAKGMDAATAALFSSAFVRSEVGQIPEGWQLLRISDLVRLIVERVEANSAKDQLRYVALDDMPARSVALTAHRPGSEVTSSITAFKKNDILFGSMRPYFHKVGLAPFDGITRTTTFVLRSIDPAFRSFALMHLSSSDAVEFATTASVGTTIPYVRWDALGSYPVVTPPRALLERFDAALDPLLERLALTGEENASLTALRDTLLPKLLSGEVRVLEGERTVAAAV